MFTLGIVRPWTCCPGRWWDRCSVKNIYSSPGLGLGYLLNFAGELGSKQGLDRRPCPELLCDSVIHVPHIHKIVLQLTQEFTDAPHHQVLQHSCQQGTVGSIPQLPKAMP